jgi:hypothetical protein
LERSVFVECRLIAIGDVEIQYEVYSANLALLTGTYIILLGPTLPPIKKR